MGYNATAATAAAAAGTPPHAGLKDGEFPLSDGDRQILAMSDEEYRLHDWDQLCEVVSTNNLSILKRKPSQLRDYIAWTIATKATYGAISTFLLAERLPKAWTLPSLSASSSPPPAAAALTRDNNDNNNLAPRLTPPASTTPLDDPSDFCILRNDWPYGFTPDVRHLVVWSRTPFPVDHASGGELTAEGREGIEAFVRRVFVARLDRDEAGGDGGGGGGAGRVLWFKNWAALQSVRALEHFHVLVRGVSDEIMDEWTTEGEGRARDNGA